MEPTNNWKVNPIKFPKLRDVDLEVYKDDQSFSVVHLPTGLNIQADQRDNALANWQLAQEALQSALEHREGALGVEQSEREGNV